MNKVQIRSNNEISEILIKLTILPESDMKNDELRVPVLNYLLDSFLLKLKEIKLADENIIDDIKYLIDDYLMNSQSNCDYLY